VNKTLFLILAVLVLASCGEVPFYRTAAPTGAITWSIDAAERAAARGLDVRSASPARMVTDPSMDVYSDYYANYGSLVGTYTPTVMRIPIGLGEIILADYNGRLDGLLDREVFIKAPSASEVDDPEQFMADFVDPIEASGVSLPAATYTLLELHFEDGHSVFYRQDGETEIYHHFVKNTVRVELPGYGGQLTDEESTSLNFGTSNWGPEDEENRDAYDAKVDELTAFPADTYFERKNTSGDVFEFTLRRLMPIEDPDPAEFETTERLPSGWYVFTSEVSAAQFGPTPNPYSTGSDQLLLPMEAITVSGLNVSATIVVSLDVEDIIEVYDNSTPGDKTDDVVVLADKYWERFSVSVIFE
jgi:hypothetical protein